MKRKISYLLTLFVATILLSCSKTEEVTVPEDQQIETYITAKKLVVTEKTATGLRYVRTLTSGGAAVKVGQSILVNYTGKLLNDTQFDTGNFSFVLGTGGVIQGFTEGIGKMKVGEKATIIFPSTLGYGATGSGSKIPGNSPLVFDIEVVTAK
jgi:FKBP-type peptidyl-prolyl cis-trans isomerase